MRLLTTCGAVSVVLVRCASYSPFGLLKQWLPELTEWAHLPFNPDSEEDVDDDADVNATSASSMMPARVRWILFPHVWKDPRDQEGKKVAHAILVLEREPSPPQATKAPSKAMPLSKEETDDGSVVAAVVSDVLPTFRVSVVSPAHDVGGSAYHPTRWSCAGGRSQPQLERRTVLTAATGVPRERLLDAGWWFTLLGVRQSAASSAQPLHDVLLPWLAQASHAEVLGRTLGRGSAALGEGSGGDDDRLACNDWREPQFCDDGIADASHHSALRHALWYCLRRSDRSVHVSRATAVGFEIRRQYVAFALSDAMMLINSPCE